jgi:hypothetical protein
MAFVFVDSDNSLAIKDVYDQRKVVSDIGGSWDPVSRLWRVTFTTYNLDFLLNHLENPSVSADMEEFVQKQIEKEARLTRLREMSKEDVPVRFKIPGLKGNLYNYQRLGVMFSVLNGVGTLLADEMGLGKTIQAIGAAMFLKSKRLAKNALIVTPASLKYNWPLEIEKFTDEKYVVIDGTPEERISQWLRDDVFFYVVNYELILEDLFGGREYKEKEEDSLETKHRKEKLAAKAHQRERILTPVRTRMWDFLSVDECFPYNTLVETDRGLLPIGYIVDYELDVRVLSCDFSSNEPSYKKVVRRIDNPLVGQLVEVTHEYGKLVCTANHKIWTEEFGYIRASDLSIHGNTHLRILHEGVSSEKTDKPFLQSGLPVKKSVDEVQRIWKDNGRAKGGEQKGSNQSDQDLRALSCRISDCEEKERRSEILFKEVCSEMVDDTTRNGCESSICEQNGRSDSVVQGMSVPVCSQDDTGENKTVLFKDMRCVVEVEERGWVGRQSQEDVHGSEGCVDGETKSRSISKDDGNESRPGISKESDSGVCSLEGNPSDFLSTRRETVHNEAAADVGSGIGNRMGDGIYGIGQKNGRCDTESAEVLLNRHCSSDSKNCRGSGRFDPQDEEMESDRCKEREGFVLSRVEGVKVLERADFERLGFSSPDNFRVYNLEVESETEQGHCYIANKVLVSNCHALKNHSSKRTRNIKMLRAKFRMGLTGTPMDGRLEELHSVMGFVAPGLLGSKARFFQMHIETDFWGKVTGYKRLGEVTKRIEPYFIRRLKKDVLKDLPDKIYENRLVSLTTEEMKIYKALADGGHEATEDAQAIVACIRCKQFCNWPKQIDDSCKSNSKMDSFKEVLEEVVVQNGHKALIFSQYKTMLDIIADVLKAMGLNYFRIDGDMDKKERVAMQARFNTDPKIDLMIGTEAMSTGLNFTAADYVINFDDNWSPSIMGQREDRCLVKNSVVFCLQSAHNGDMSLVKIQDVRVGDHVLTHTGNKSVVTDCDSHEHRGMMTTIEYVGWWEPLVCTHDHKVFIKRDGKLVWVEAHDILPSDSMVFPKFKGWDRLEKVVVKDSWRLFPKPQKVCVICGEPVEARRMCRVHYREWVEKNRGKVKAGSGACSNGRYVRLPDEIEIDDRWLRLFGWYAAEGFASVRKGKSRFVSFSGHQDEEPILLDLGKTLRGIGVRCEICRNKKTKGIELRAYSGELALWFMDWFGHGAKNKTLPVEMLNLPPDQAAVFLRGYTDGDGYQRNRQVEWVSASQTMCYQMCQLAIRSGFIPTMRMVVHPRTKTRHYIGAYTKFGSPDNKRLADQDEQYVYRPVRRVETKMDKVRVYDLSVEGDHSFTTGFASVHNCHRIGQRNVVTVVNFICKNTIEERIRDVIYGKNKITAEVLGDPTDEIILNRLNPKDIAKLL